MKNTLQQPKELRIIKNIPPDAARIWHDGGEWIIENEEGQCWNKKIACPYQPGDRLWVRKAWQLVVSVKAERLQDMGVRPFMASSPNPWVWVVEFKKI